MGMSERQRAERGRGPGNRHGPGAVEKPKNFKAAFRRLTQALHPLLKAAANAERPAKVINITSIDGQRLNAWETYSYHASKSALIYLTKPEMFTVPIALKSFLDSTGGSNWGAMFAMSIVSLIPVFLVFLFGQKFLIRGIATTGIK